MTNALTINQEKQIRGERTLNSETLNRLQQKLAVHIDLAKHISLYRRAQRLQTKEAAELREDLLVQIDACLERLGVE